MLLNDVLAGLILASGFPLGHLLYLWSKEEVDWVRNKYKFLNKLEKIILPFAVISGLLAGVFVKSIEVFLVLFFINLLISSFAIKERKQILFSFVLFLTAFFAVYFTTNYWKGL